MFSLLLALIYISFISLGLPDSLLGSAWPIMVSDLDTHLSYAGIVSMIISAGTIISSLLADKLTYRLGTGVVTVTSVFMTAAALFGFSISGDFPLLCVFAIPYGLGAGAIDAALNNYVAVHYTSRHMNWLHCFWGLGATVGPYIMGRAISASHGWRTGYSTVALIQLSLAFVLLITLPLWKKNKAQKENVERKAPVALKDAVKIRGVKSILVAFFGYCAYEATAMLWASSYLVKHRGVNAETAASFASLFFIGITAGRFACGFFSDRVGDKNMIRLGTAVTAVGLVLTALPITACSLLGLVIIGIGAAPVYPAIIHSTPKHFGEANSGAIVGIQMASAYTGSTLAPPVFGLIAQYLNIGLFPFYMCAFVLLMFIMTERVNKVCKA